MLKRDPNRTGASDDRLAFEQHLTLGRGEETCEDPGKCRLARPVVPGDHDALTRWRSRSTSSSARDGPTALPSAYT